MALLEDNFHERANLLIDAFPEGQSFDFVQAFARELPLQAICMILGVPQEDRAHLCDLIELGLEADSPNVVAVDYIKKIQEYAREIIAEKRRNPADDILSTIVHATLADEDNRQLTDEELVNFFILLFPAGAETTRNAFGYGLRTLVENPEQLARLRDAPDRMRSAIEEIVRWTTPSIYKRRTVTRDIEFHGASLKTGDKLTIWEMSANRDDRIFNNPFTFDIARMPNRHIGFGFGAHICLGAALATFGLSEFWTLRSKARPNGSRIIGCSVSNDYLSALDLKENFDERFERPSRERQSLCPPHSERWTAALSGTEKVSNAIRWKMSSVTSGRTKTSSFGAFARHLHDLGRVKS